jgi:transcriptional regulator with XRE-family HTH domain
LGAPIRLNPAGKSFGHTAFVTHPVTLDQSRNVTNVSRTVITRKRGFQYVAEMVTRIYRHRRRLFLKEHREAKGISAEAMAGRLGIERESVYRLEREAMTRATPEKQAAYASALNVEPEELWHPPGTTRLDPLVSGASDELKQMAADIVRRLIAGRG